MILELWKRRCSWCEIQGRRHMAQSGGSIFPKLKNTILIYDFIWIAYRLDQNLMALDVANYRWSWRLWRWRASTTTTTIIRCHFKNDRTCRYRWTSRIRRRSTMFNFLTFQNNFPSPYFKYRKYLEGHTSCYLIRMRARGHVQIMFNGEVNLWEAFVGIPTTHVFWYLWK